jgi:Uma2 family endonuclease
MPSLTSKISLEEYLELERNSATRHEYVDGELVSMAGERRQHNRLVRRLVVLLEELATAKGCELVAENVKVRTRKSRVRYPDIAISCNPGDDEYFLEHPCFIAEVLSPNTRNVDFITKLSEYKNLPSLETYALLSPDMALVVLYRRIGERWEVETLEEQGQVDVPCLGISIELSQLYSHLAQVSPAG